jgi:TrpR-related protein YerC/YecD
MKKTHTKENELFEAILNLKNLEECQKFFTDLCTPSELHAMSDRWEVAKLLQEEMPYRAIYEETGTSTATVTRVARCLAYGDGYRLLLDRTKKKVRS